MQLLAMKKESCGLQLSVPCYENDNDNEDSNIRNSDTTFRSSFGDHQIKVTMEKQTGEIIQLCPVKGHSTETIQGMENCVLTH